MSDGNNQPIQYNHPSSVAAEAEYAKTQRDIERAFESKRRGEPAPPAPAPKRPSEGLFRYDHPTSRTPSREVTTPPAAALFDYSNSREPGDPEPAARRVYERDARPGDPPAAVREVARDRPLFVYDNPTSREPGEGAQAAPEAAPAGPEGAQAVPEGAPAWAAALGGEIAEPFADVSASFGELVTTHKLPPEAASAVAGLAPQIFEKATEHFVAEQAAEHERVRQSWAAEAATLPEIVKVGGLERAHHMARQVLDRFATPEFAEFARETALESHPQFLRFLIKLNAATGSGRRSDWR